MILYTIMNIYLLLSISSDGWQIHCSPTYIIDFLDLELCSVIYTLLPKGGGNRLLRRERNLPGL